MAADLLGVCLWESWGWVGIVENVLKENGANEDRNTMGKAIVMAEVHNHSPCMIPMNPQSHCIEQRGQREAAMLAVLNVVVY